MSIEVIYTYQLNEFNSFASVPVVLGHGLDIDSIDVLAHIRHRWLIYSK